MSMTAAEREKLVELWAKVPGCKDLPKIAAHSEATVIRRADVGSIPTPYASGNGWTLYHGDCLKILPTLTGVDAVVTDPPYGIGEHGGKCRTRGKPGYSKHKNKGWDASRPSRDVFDAMLSLDVPSVIWGGNYFADMLPPSMGWMYWRKLMGGDFSDGELAWTSKRGALKEFTKCPKGMNKEHPCEKPVPLIVWCMDRMGIPEGDTILDPFTGSGTTGVACIKTGRKFIGIELDEGYCEIAARRMREAESHLFAEVKP